MRAQIENIPSSTACANPGRKPFHHAFMSNSPLTYARGCVRDCGTPEARVFAVLLIFLILLILLILSGLLQNMLFLALPVNGVIYPYLWILRWGITTYRCWHMW